MLYHQQYLNDDDDFHPLGSPFQFCRRDADCAEYNREKKETLDQFRDDFVESTGSVDLDKVTMQVNCRVPTSLTTQFTLTSLPSFPNAVSSESEEFQFVSRFSVTIQFQIEIT